MIIKLMPDQISQLWDSIRYGVINAVAPIVDPNPDNMQDILCQLLRQDMQCWCVIEEDKKILGYIVTSITVDTNTKFRSLMIYSLFLYKGIDDDMWADAYAAIEKFAEVNKCTRLIAYSANDRAIEIAKKFDFNSDYTYLVKELGG